MNETLDLADLSMMLPTGNSQMFRTCAEWDCSACSGCHDVCMLDKNVKKNWMPRRMPTWKGTIAVDGADHGYRDLRIENTLTDEYGDDVKLNKGAHVEVTVTAQPKKPIP